METVRREREQIRRHVLNAIGLNGNQMRGFAAELAGLGAEAAILSLPFIGGTAEEEQPLQDPVTGQPFFMAGVSAVGGDDPVGAPVP